MVSFYEISFIKTCFIETSENIQILERFCVPITVEPEVAMQTRGTPEDGALDTAASSVAAVMRPRSSVATFMTFSVPKPNQFAPLLTE